MLLSESGSRLAIVVWAVVWLPGLAFASWRAERLLRARRLPRALLEPAAMALLPLLAFAFYALPDAQRYARAHGTSVSWGSYFSVAQVAVPYLVSAAYLLAVLGPSTSPPAGTRWWVGLLLGMLSVLVLAPGLLMTQLMVFVGT